MCQASCLDVLQSDTFLFLLFQELLMIVCVNACWAIRDIASAAVVAAQAVVYTDISSVFAATAIFVELTLACWLWRHYWSSWRLGSLRYLVRLRCCRFLAIVFLELSIDIRLHCQVKAFLDVSTVPLKEISRAHMLPELFGGFWLISWGKRCVL